MSKYTHLGVLRDPDRPAYSYNGKSTGSGALGIWLHHLKDISFKKWSDAHYTGTAIKLGAGVQGFEAYEAADARGESAESKKISGGKLTQE
jgi:hypothetical protein